MRLILNKTHLNTLIAHTQENYPMECCGYLLGTFSQMDNQVLQIYPMTNAHATPKTHFSLKPQEQLQALKAPFDIIGVYHSHPNSPPIPSQEDLNFMFFPHYSNLIISLENGIRFASYRRIAEQITQEEVFVML